MKKTGRSEAVAEGGRVVREKDRGVSLAEMVFVRSSFCGVLASCIGQWGSPLSGDVCGVVVI